MYYYTYDLHIYTQIIGISINRDIVTARFNRMLSFVIPFSDSILPRGRSTAERASMLRENVHDPEIEFHGNKRMDIPSLPDIPAEVEGHLGRFLMVFGGSSHTSKNKVFGSLAYVGGSEKGHLYYESKFAPYPPVNDHIAGWKIHHVAFCRAEIPCRWLPWKKEIRVVSLLVIFWRKTALRIMEKNTSRICFFS